MTSHPKDVGEDLISLFGEYKNLCSHFHLPVQSGSDKLLERMRRQYNREYYIKVAEGLRKARPDIALTTDFIVGFPGEDEKDFEDSISLMDEVRFDFSYSFSYSPRPGTTALRFEDHIPESEKRKRLDILQNRQRQISLEKNERLIGSVEEVLVESFSPEGLKWMGRTSSNKIVYFTLAGKWDEKGDMLGKTVSVKMSKAQPHSLIGELYE